MISELEEKLKQLEKDIEHPGTRFAHIQMEKRVAQQLGIPTKNSNGLIWVWKVTWGEAMEEGRAAYAQTLSDALDKAIAQAQSPSVLQQTHTFSGDLRDLLNV